MFKTIALTTTLISASATMAANATCQNEVVVNSVAAAVRGRPNLHGTKLWEITARSEVAYCGKSQTDDRGISWHWISFKTDGEPWDHDGWVSSKILEPAMTPQTTQALSPPQSGITTEPGMTVEPRINDHQRQWNTLVADAIAKNGSFPIHSCQPEYKLCNTGIAYPNRDKSFTMIRVQKDTDGAIISRDICKFNNDMDIRDCTDFDTSATSKEMKNSSDKWISID